MDRSLKEEIDGEGDRSTFSSTVSANPDDRRIVQHINRGWFSWVWPTSEERAFQAELALLQLGGLSLVSSITITTYTTSLSSSSIFHDRIPIISDFSLNNPEHVNTLIYHTPPNNGVQGKVVDVVLVHGFGAGLGFWYRNIKPLGDCLPSGSRVLACDWLGMGRSSRPPFPKFQPGDSQAVQRAISFFVNALEEWRKQVPNLSPFVLVGHSLGGYLAVHYAQRYPQHVSKLILASPIGIPRRIEGLSEDTTVTGRTIPGWLVVLWKNHYTPQSFVRGCGPLGPRLVQNFVRRRFPYLTDAELECLSEYAYHISSQQGSGEYALGTILSPGAWAREPLESVLPTVTVPTFFLFGAEDWIDHVHAVDCSRLMYPTSSSADSQSIQNERVIQIPHAGHQLHMDNPEAFNSVLLDIILP